MLKAMPEPEQPTSPSKWVLIEAEPAILPFDPFSRVPFVWVTEILRNLLSEESAGSAAENSSDNDPSAD